MKPEVTIDPDDPRLSAFLLGEMPAEEALVFEAQLRHSPEARTELEMMRTAVAMLRHSFEAEWQDGMKAETKTPSLTILPSPEVGRVIDFRNEPIAESAVRNRRFPSRVAAVASLAAAIALAASMLPKSTPGVVANSLPVAGTEVKTTANETPSPADASGSLATTEVVAPVAPAEDFFPKSYTAAPISVPSLGYDSASNAGGFRQVSAYPSLTGDAAPATARPLGADPTITAVRFLSDDPIDIQPIPLPAELLSYLPDSSSPAEADRTLRHLKTTAGAHQVSAQLLGAANVYLDRKKYPDPKIVHRQVELTGGVFQLDDGKQTRSLYRAEQRSDAAGGTSVIVKGVVRLEVGNRVEEVSDEPDPSFKFGITPVSHSNVNSGGFHLPSGGSLKKAAIQSVGPSSPDQISDGIATRYIVRQHDRHRRAAGFAETGRRLLEKGEYGSAASNFELALEILPEAPATETLRSQIMGRLEKANAALAE